MQIELLPHLDEIYIRRYDPDATGQPWPSSVVDVPMTLRVGDCNFYLTCRRDVDGVWVAFCNERERARMLASFYAFRPDRAEALMNDTLRQASRRIRDVVAALPEPLTRRDALERMIRDADVRTLLSRPLDIPGYSVRLCCMPTLEMLVVVWCDTQSHLQDARALSHSQWRILGPRIEAMLENGMHDSLRRELLQTVYPEGLPPSLMFALAQAE